MTPEVATVRPVLRICAPSGLARFSAFWMMGQFQLRQPNLESEMERTAGGLGYSFYFMRPYRAFVVNEDGHFQKAVVLYCADDVVAVQEAKKLVDGKDIELWEMERRVATLKSSNKSAGEFRLKAAKTPVCAQCGREMRLQRLEPDVKTHKKMQTYRCPTCGLSDRVKAEE
jgi:DNA-directed RNA polymerase subunit RPC12/RpoP